MQVRHRLPLGRAPSQAKSVAAVIGAGRTPSRLRCSLLSSAQWEATRAAGVPGPPPTQAPGRRRGG